MYGEETDIKRNEREKEFKISSISDLMVFDRNEMGLNIKQNDINKTDNKDLCKLISSFFFARRRFRVFNSLAARALLSRLISMLQDALFCRR
jgi:hypothetical protein